MPGAEETVVRKLPVGPLLGIMPWNFPYYQVARFAAPNLMLGNTILLKHAPSCPQSALLMEEIFVAAGLPADAYVNVFATNDQIADMIADPRVQGVSLTGSERAGAAVAEVAGRNLKKVVLELGGSDAFIVLDTDDLDATVKSATRGRMSNTGQACNAAKRFIVTRAATTTSSSSKLTAVVRGDVPGDPMDPKTRDRPALLAGRRRHACRAGTTPSRPRAPRCSTGGKRVDGPGAYVEPTLLTDVTPGMRAYPEELFGPVGVVYKVGDGRRGRRAGQRLVVRARGSVWSTDPDARPRGRRPARGRAWPSSTSTAPRCPELPFGGVKRSGFGRELGPWGMDEFVNKKLVRVSKG